MRPQLGRYEGGKVTSAPVIALCLLWYISGVWGFIYWWTTEYDLELEEFLLALVEGFLGPVTWLLGAFFHGSSIVVVKRRRK